MTKTSKRGALGTRYVSPKQLILPGFETPFSNQLDPNNRWVALAHKIPWDELCGVYYKKCNPKSTGRPGINPRIAIGAIIIKHMCNFDDRETVSQISENMYMQYFLGYSSFSTTPAFDPSLFVEFRHRLGDDVIDKMNEKILCLSERKREGHKSDQDNGEEDGLPTHKGRALFDATACPQDIAYPTDLNLLSEAREISERLIDQLYQRPLHKQKPRTYRKVARREYLQVAQKKVKHKKVLRKAIRGQLGYLKRNLDHIDGLLDAHPYFPLRKKDQKYLMVLHTLYDQQNEMFLSKTHQIPDRIVSIHQPHVRPIVRGKTPAKVEFGAKIHLSLVNGYSFLDTISWDAFNEGSCMMGYIDRYHGRFGFYPEEVLADKIYCTRDNRRKLKGLGIRLVAKPLGRPKAVETNHVRPGERNPIEGKFGQAKTAYGLNRVRARLADTSQSWIASIILVLNLVKLAGEAPLCLLLNLSVMTEPIFRISINNTKTGGLRLAPVFGNS